MHRMEMELHFLGPLGAKKEECLSPFHIFFLKKLLLLFQMIYNLPQSQAL